MASPASPEHARPSVGTCDHRLLALPEGGSLARLRFRRDVLIKTYSGKLARGHAQLRREYQFLAELSPPLISRFARPLLFVDRPQPRQTKLYLRRHPEPAVTKAILRGQLAPDRTRAIVDASLRVLLEELYPTRQRTLPAAELYAQFHAPRLLSALADLRRLPVIGQFVTASDLMVNGVTCPSTATTVAWLQAHGARRFSTARLVAAHGNLHPDNILAPTEGPLSVRFVDPRGDLTLPAHYDFAKMLKSLTAGYDLIHYGLAELQMTTRRGTVLVDLALDHSFDAHYRAALDALVAALPAYAAAEQVTPSAFLAAAAVAEVVHIISFSADHAHHPRGRDPNRVLAFLATAALLARDLMTEARPQRQLTQPLVL